MKTFLTTRRLTKHGSITIPKHIMAQLPAKAGDSYDIKVDFETGAISLTPVSIVCSSCGSIDKVGLVPVGENTIRLCNRCIRAIKKVGVKK